MKVIALAPKVYSRILKGQEELYERDFEDGLKSCTPGEWVVLSSEKEWRFAAYVNPFAENGIMARVVQVLDEQHKTYDPVELVAQNIKKALDYRKTWDFYKTGCRLVYGQTDALPGLIIDSYLNGILVQINTAGMELHRTLIRNLLQSEFGRPIYYLDNPEYRKNECLPQVESGDFPEHIDVLENGFRYQLPGNMIQKIGYYYDHRANREKLRQSLKSMNKHWKNGLDLFSYMGSWGLHLLDTGVEQVTFVDQGNFDSIYHQTMELNKIEMNRWNFIRQDVFAQLDRFKQEGREFDIIVSDPPAFKKKEQNKEKALGGYQKLHAKILGLLTPNSLMVAGSCTQGITLGELDKTVADAALMMNRKVQLIDVGIQAGDHPMKNLAAKEHYIKYLLYRVE